MRRPDRSQAWGLLFSIGVHWVALSFLGVAWIHPAHVAVQPGENSIDIELISTPTPEPVATPAPLPTPSKPQESIAHAVPIAVPAPASAPQEAPSQIAHRASFASVGSESARPDFLQNLSPAYPEASRTAHEQGIVFLSVAVTADGTPARVAVAQSSGFPRLDQAAFRAVRSWKFKPATVGGVAIASQVTVPVRFELRGP